MLTLALRLNTNDVLRNSIPLSSFFNGNVITSVLPISALSDAAVLDCYYFLLLTFLSASK